MEFVDIDESPIRQAARMNLDLLVPELFWPAAAGSEPYRDLALPALEILLARGERTRTTGTSVERWLAGAYQLDHELSLAPYSLRGDGGEPADHVWARADPVHLRVHGDRLVLADAARLALTADEAREYVAALSPHFAADGMAFFAPVPQRWYVRLPAEPRLVAPPTSEVAGRSIESFLPAGTEGGHWRRMVNEVQMLLHEHPCNRARESRGQLAINSVWLWGAGRARALAAPFEASWTDHPVAAGLAGASARRLPASAAGLLDARGRGAQLAVLASLPAQAYGDLAQWREAVIALERAWLAPLLDAVRDGALGTVTLHGLGPDFSYRSTLGRRDRWRFWQPRRPLFTYVSPS